LYESNGTKSLVCLAHQFAAYLDRPYPPTPSVHAQYLIRVRLQVIFLLYGLSVERFPFFGSDVILIHPTDSVAEYEFFYLKRDSRRFQKL
jgi:hypothetical protein